MSNTSSSTTDLLAIDVGNTRVKLGLFTSVDGGCVTTALSGDLPIAAPRLPEPAETLASTLDELIAGALHDWLQAIGDVRPRIALASVSRPAEEALAALLSHYDVQRMASETAPITLRVDEPTRIGVDRVMAAVAANRLRHDGRPAIVVDVGTAITVDLIATDGALEGGAILPGPTLAARALAEKTDRLPDIQFGDLGDAPDAVGRSTEPAILAGVFWGAVGAIRELIARQRDRLTDAPQVFLTGGAAPSVARLIGGPDLSVRCVPHLTLAGVALAAGVDR
ncbi:Type III pantothenate kinase [Botrimarina colliarenosi]|uniref:Type III pantothenate kinase n=1 Tax=Botrimarina colliarenosi TaxID=2528001 RepID=A0A5C6AIC7_9BACT|nr:type III pantothenate kinase [Botrimarina colliarenosi]TWT99802.1 Type III pantothenate kinase [Botrimarina colliarenosi]